MDVTDLRPLHLLNIQKSRIQYCDVHPFTFRIVFSVDLQPVILTSSLHITNRYSHQGLTAIRNYDDECGPVPQGSRGPINHHWLQWQVHNGELLVESHHP